MTTAPNLTWRKTTSHVVDPEVAAYWQRWENDRGDGFGWIELPHDMPEDLVHRVIAQVAAIESEALDRMGGLT